MGDEYKGEFGDCVLITRKSEILNKVYFIDELLTLNELDYHYFVKVYKPTGRVNIALKNLFNENNYERKENVK